VRQWLATSRWPRLLGLSLVLAVVGAILLFTVGHRYRVKRSYAVAEKNWEEGNYRKAVELYQAVLDEYPSDPLAGQAHFRIGTTYYLFLQQEREAILAFRDLTKTDPSGSWGRKAQKKLGEIFENRLQDYRQAVVEYQRLINLSPSVDESEEAQLAVARCYFKLGDFTQAREEYEIFLERYPGSPRRDRALDGLASTCYVTRRYQSAITYYRMVISESKDPELRAEAGFGIASCLEEAGSLKAALKQFMDIREEHPNAELVRQRIDRLQEKLARKN
jgi:TolA-binding protein